MSTRSGASKVKRVVFDTNILISAYLWPGTPRKALDIIRDGHYALFTSRKAIKEFVRVLGYSKFGLTAKEISPLVEDLMTLATLVNPKKEIDVIPNDPTDNLFLSIALEANCPYIVSGDRHLLHLIEYRDIKIITASEFVQIAK